MWGEILNRVGRLVTPVLLDAAAKGLVLLLAGLAYFILSRLLIAHHGQDSLLATALGSDLKGRISLLLYLSAVPLAFVVTWLACALYVVVAIMWLIPYRRIEELLSQSASNRPRH